jgi:hypothetical protein
MIRGNISRQIVEALQDSPKTIGELAAIVYGDDDQWNREAARMAILRLRKNKLPVDSEWLYTYRGGQPHSDSGNITLRILDSIRDQPKGASELALAIFQDNGRLALKRAYCAINRLRSKHSVKIDVEMRYFWRGEVAALGND